MITSFFKPNSTRQLYFFLSNAFQFQDPLSSPTYKIAGLYSIHKNNKCYYVGQSKNLPSRLADHLSGKYSVADEFRAYFVCDESFSDFYDRSKASHKAILETNEMKLMQVLKPIDNLVIDYDQKIEEKYLFELFQKEERLHDCVGYLNGNLVTVTIDERVGLKLIDERVFEAHEQIRKSAGLKPIGDIL